MNRLAVAAAGLLAACGDPAGPDPLIGPLRISFADAGFADTIGTSLAKPFKVTISDSTGRPVSDTTVVLAATYGAFLAGSASQRDKAVKTDADGNAQVAVTLDTVAGSYFLRAIVLGTSVRDSIPLTVKAGKAVSLSLAPRDSVVYVGNSYGVRATRRDRKGNLADDIPVFTALTGGVASVADSVVTGTAFGRTHLMATIGSLKDSVLVSVIPKGQIAAYASPAAAGAPPSAFHIVDLDGSGHKAITARAGGAVRYDPTGSKLVFHSNESDGLHLFSVNPDGSSLVQLSPFAGTNQESQPQMSRDGNWIYYTAFVGDLSVWRATSTFGNPTRLTPPGKKEFTPTPSPDGGRIAYFEGLFGVQPIHIRTLGTGAVDTTNVVGAALRWSPVGDEIAYVVGNQLRVYNTATRAITVLDSSQAHHFQDPHVEWAPDGEWLLSCAYYNNPNPTGYLVLVRRSPVLVVPLTWSKTWNLCSAAWKP